MIGSYLNERYRLDVELGQGGVGAVYRAYDTLLGRTVAVKLLSDPNLSQESWARLLREAQAVAQLNHPKIASVHDVGEADGLPFIVMELVEGETLHQRRPESLDEVLEIACQLCAALEHAHAHGIVHRDLKPENVLIAADGTAKLVDFGLARTVASRLTAEGTFMGTVFYVAPEQALGQELDGRADLYSLGVMLYELSTGQLPFTGDTPLAVISQHLHAQAEPPRSHKPALPPGLEVLSIQLMSKQPEDRPASAAAVREALRELLGAPSPERSPAEALDRRPTGPPFLREELGERIGAAPVFVARERELGQLDAHLEAVLGGGGGVVFVTGGSGRGKTALLSAFGRRALEAHPELLVASGSCNVYSGIGDPYNPFRELMAMLTGEVEAHWTAGTVSTTQARRLWAALPQAVGALLDHGPHVIPALLPGRPLLARANLAASQEAPWLGRLRERVERPGTGAEGLEQSYLFQQVTNVLRALSEGHPLLLTLDDLQWADLASIGLLFHLGRRLQGGRILILAAYRPEEVALGRGGERHPLEKVLSEFKRQFGDVWLDLARVEAAEGRQFVDALLKTVPNRLGERFRRALLDHTGGHPLFTVELLRTMQEGGSLVKDRSGRWVRGPRLNWHALPARVEGVIEERIGRLDEELRRILSVASVEGETFTAQVLARVLGVDEGGLLQTLSQELEKRHHLVREQGARSVGSHTLWRYRFSHGLFQQYLYDDLGGGERTALHRAMGGVLEELYQDDPEAMATIAGQLVRHFAGDVARERHYAKLAGDRAAAQYANKEAIRYLSCSLELSPETEYVERYELLLARERVYGLQGDRESQARDLASMGELAAALDSDEKRSQVALCESNLARATGDLQSALSAAGQCIALAQEAGNQVGEVRGYLAWGQALMLQGEYHWARGRLTRALDLADSLGRPELVSLALRVQGGVSFHLGDHAGARRFYERSLSIVRQIGNRQDEASALNNLGAVVGDQGDLPSARDFFEQTLAIRREMGDRAAEGLTLNNLGVLARDLGDYVAARDYLERAMTVHRETANRPGQVYTLNDLGFVGNIQGDHSGACGHYEQALATAREIGDRRGEGYALTGLGDCRAGGGGWAEAMEAYRSAVDLREELRQPHLAMESRAALARAAMKQGDLDRAHSEIAPVLAYLDAGKSLDGTDAPLRIYLTCCRVLGARQDARAEAVLITAHDLLQERANKISDEGMRRQFLENVPAHREILEAFSRRG